MSLRGVTICEPSEEEKKLAVWTGVLLKEGHFIKNWKSRFFVLTENPPKLSYYESKTSKLVKGTLMLSTFVIQPAVRANRPNAFLIRSLAGGTLTIDCSQQLKDELVNCIRRMVPSEEMLKKRVLDLEASHADLERQLLAKENIPDIPPISRALSLTTLQSQGNLSAERDRLLSELEETKMRLAAANTAKEELARLNNEIHGKWTMQQKEIKDLKALHATERRARQELEDFKSKVDAAMEHMKQQLADEKKRGDELQAAIAQARMKEMQARLAYAEGDPEQETPPDLGKGWIQSCCWFSDETCLLTARITFVKGLAAVEDAKRKAIKYYVQYRVFEERNGEEHTLCKLKTRVHRIEPNNSSIEFLETLNFPCICLNDELRVELSLWREHNSLTKKDALLGAVSFPTTNVDHAPVRPHWQALE